MKSQLVDHYIEKSELFSQEILLELRRRIHCFCPEMEESIKWSFPCFSFKGKIICFFSSHKNHCSFGFWQAKEMKNLDPENKELGMGQFGKMKSLKDLPSENIFEILMTEAIEVSKIMKPKENKSTNKLTIVESKDLLEKLNKNKQALFYFDKFSNSQKKEYHHWILEAKAEQTKIRRIEQALEWISVGKSRNWKYEKKKY